MRPTRQLVQLKYSKSSNQVSITVNSRQASTRIPHPLILIGPLLLQHKAAAYAGRTSGGASSFQASSNEGPAGSTAPPCCALRSSLAPSVICHCCLGVGTPPMVLLRASTRPSKVEESRETQVTCREQPHSYAHWATVVICRRRG